MTLNEIHRDVRRFPLTATEIEQIEAEQTAAREMQEEFDELRALASANAANAGSTAYVSVVASQFTPAFSPLALNGAIANSAGTKAAGITSEDTQVGFVATVTTLGAITNASWSWTPDSPVYLSGTNLSQVPPSTGFVQQLGTAKSSDTLFVYPQQPVLL